MWNYFLMARSGKRLILSCIFRLPHRLVSLIFGVAYVTSSYSFGCVYIWNLHFGQRKNDLRKMSWLIPAWWRLDVTPYLGFRRQSPFVLARRSGKRRRGNSVKLCNLTGLRAAIANDAVLANYRGYRTMARECFTCNWDLGDDPKGAIIRAGIRCL
jgi:hypothetical protein